MAHVWRCDGSQSEVLPLAGMRLQISYKKEKTEYVLPCALRES